MNEMTLEVAEVQKIDEVVELSMDDLGKVGGGIIDVIL